MAGPVLAAARCGRVEDEKRRVSRLRSVRRQDERVLWLLCLRRVKANKQRLCITPVMSKCHVTQYNSKVLLCLYVHIDV